MIDDYDANIVEDDELLAADDAYVKRFASALKDRFGRVTEATASALSFQTVAGALGEITQDAAQWDYADRLKALRAGQTARTMPEYRRSPDVLQGYNFKKDKQLPLGFITKLKIGTVDIVADQDCTGPLDSKPLKVVAVLSGVQWDTGITDGIYLAGQISTPNRQIVASMLYNELVNVDVQLQLSLFEYDPIAKEFFVSFTSEGALKGLLEKRGEDLNVSVADDVSTEVQLPENYAFMIGIKPRADAAQALTIATSKSKSVSKAWGLKAG